MPSLLGFRANVIRNDDYTKSAKVYSPAHGEFQWTERVAWAKCHLCPKNTREHIDIQEGCNCGIHLTLDPSELSYYSYRTDTSVPMLMEALDNAWMHEQGITASGVAVVAVIRYPENSSHRKGNDEDMLVVYNRQTLCLGIAAKFFGVPIVDYETAVYATEIKWNEYGQGEPPFPYHLYTDLFKLTLQPDGTGKWVPKKGKYE